VNAAAPGIIATPMTAGLFDAKAIKQLVPMNRCIPVHSYFVCSYLQTEARAAVEVGRRRDSWATAATGQLRSYARAKCLPGRGRSPGSQELWLPNRPPPTLNL
jgi:hypothetical protein